jgi:hypothetical protein
VIGVVGRTERQGMRRSSYAFDVQRRAATVDASVIGCPRAFFDAQPHNNMP